MHLSAALTAELASLDQTLDDPTVDMLETLDSLGATAALAVNSFLGLTVTATAGEGQGFTLTAMQAATSSVPGASIRMPLSIFAPPTLDDEGSAALAVAVDGAVIFYAGTPGAFVDLAADISWLSGSSAGLVLDHDLVPPDPEGESGLDDIVAVNQAVGMLLARGFLPDQARTELDRWAALRGGDRISAARWLLTDLDSHDTR
jgi:hypothetical protein